MAAGTASTYLSRTPSGSGSNSTFTISFWIKRSQLGSPSQILLTGGTDGGSQSNVIYFDTSDRLACYQGTGGNQWYTTNLKYYDTTSWYHIVNTFDSTATGTDKIKLWVNGNLVTNYNVDNRSSFTNCQDINQNVLNRWGSGATANYFMGYMAQICMADGTAYAATDFGSVDATTGVWKPKSDGELRSGITFGTNGYLLPFSNASYLGYDYQSSDRSGTTNDFTVSGNGYKTINNPSNGMMTLNRNWNSVGYWSSSGGGDTGQQGMLNFANTGSGYPSSAHAASMGIYATKTMPFYYEVQGFSADDISFGVMAARPTGGVGQSYDDPTCFQVRPYAGSAKWIKAGTMVSQSDITGAGHFMIAVDPVNNKMWAGKDGTWIGDPAAGTGNTFDLTADTEWTVACHNYVSNSSNIFNFNFGEGYFGSTSAGATNADDAGQGVFKYDVPAGFYTFNLKNLKTYG